MDNRTLAAVVISLVLWYAWMVLFAPPPPPMEEEAASLASPTTEEVAAAKARPVDVPSPRAPPAGRPSGDPPTERHPVSLCEARGVVGSDDGGLRSLTLPAHEARYDVQPLWYWAFRGFPMPWKPYGDEPGPVTLVSEAGRAFVASAGSTDRLGDWASFTERSDSAVTTRHQRGSILVERTLRQVEGDPCEIELTVTWRNEGSGPWTEGLWVAIYDRMEEHGSRYDANVRPVALLGGSLQTWDDTTDEAPPAPVAGDVGAFGLASHYFAAVALPRTEGGTLFAGSLATEGSEDRRHGVHWVDERPLESGTARTATFTIYVGPKESNALAAVDEELTSLISLGFLSFIARPLLWLLKQIFGFVGNWGLAIILLVVVVKAAFYRLTRKAFESSQAMQEIQPLAKEIQTTYKNNPEELQRRLMALYRDNGVNPLGGCLPMLLQMPVWFALYSVLLSAVELYHTEFFYLKDLSQPDPYMLSPALVTGLMFGQQLLMPTANLDPAQARLMRMMPLVFGLLFFTFPSGLVVYVFVNTLLSMLQQIYIKRTFSIQKAVAAEGTGGT